jgi:hypothetical protein
MIEAEAATNPAANATSKDQWLNKIVIPFKFSISFERF